MQTVIQKIEMYYKHIDQPHWKEVGVKDFELSSFRNRGVYETKAKVTVYKHRALLT